MSSGGASEPGGACGAAAGKAAGSGSPVFRLVVLASGSGTNLQAIIDGLHRQPVLAPDGRGGAPLAAPASEAAPKAPPTAPPLTAASAPTGAPLAGSPTAPPPLTVAPPLIEVVLVVSDQPEARALERARAAGIATVVLPIGGFTTRGAHDQALIAAVAAARPDLVVLAGYMRLVASEFVRAFPWRVINLHPALLPAFPGTTSINDAVHYGVKVTGVTVHFVDEGLDTGAIIAQEPVPVEEGDTADSLAARIHVVEHDLLPATIRMIAAGRVHPPLPGTRQVQVDWNNEKD